MAKKELSKGAKPMDKKQMKKTKGGLAGFDPGAASLTLPDDAASCVKGTHLKDVTITVSHKL